MRLVMCMMAAGVLASGCASTGGPAIPAGMKPGQFVSFSCPENKSFQARASEDGKTVRVRSLHGSAELDARNDGVYEGDGYMLKTTGEGAVSLDHAGKSQGKGCKAA